MEDVAERMRRASRCSSAPHRSPNPILSGLLKRAGVKHEVLNAKQHEHEAAIIALAGAKVPHGGHQHGRPRHGHHPGWKR